MFEKTKLSLWDFFVSTLSGFAIVLSVLVHCLFKGLITWEIILDSSSALIAVAGFLIILLLGLLFEPLANYATKILTTCPYNYPELFGFKTWDGKIKSFEKIARTYIPEEIEGETYQYCKNWLQQNASDVFYMSFLAKYGFYRSMFFLLLLNAICIPFIYQSVCIKIIILSSFLLVLALVYLHRSGDFHRHMNTTVYMQFISLLNTKNKNN